MSKKKPLKINKEEIEQKEGMVILPVSEYQKLLKNSAPVQNLTGEEAKKLDETVKEGLRNYEEGNTETVNSISELE